MSTSSCTPVVVDGWGGAGDGCLAIETARGTLAVVEEAVRGSLPEHWQSSAAEEFTARVGELLAHAGRLGELVTAAHERAAALAAAVAVARSEP